jgi:hypothetical protein
MTSVYERMRPQLEAARAARTMEGSEHKCPVCGTVYMHAISECDWCPGVSPTPMIDPRFPAATYGNDLKPSPSGCGAYPTCRQQAVIGSGTIYAPGKGCPCAAKGGNT